MTSEAMSSLRRLSFPESIESALHQLKSLFDSSSADIPGLGDTREEQAERIVTEFIFLQGGHRKHSKRLSAMQELVVAQMLSAHIQQTPRSESQRHQLMRILFSAEPNQARLRVLYKLVSLAVSLQMAEVLDAAASWMQLSGCASNASRQMVECVIEDFFVYLPAQQPAFKQIRALSPHLACNMVATLTYIYQPTEIIAGKKCVPPELLITITSWLADDPRLCLVSLSRGALLQSHRSTLWTSPSKPARHTPLPGLVSWCTRAPLANQTQDSLKSQSDNSGSTSNSASKSAFNFSNTASGLPVKDGSGHLSQASTAPNTSQVISVAANLTAPSSGLLSPSSANVSSSPNPASLSSIPGPVLWSRLHLAVMHTLLEFPSVPGASQLELLTVADVTRIVRDVVVLVGKLSDKMESADAQTAVDRLLQILQVALVTGGFRCSLGDLKNIFAMTPRLGEILERHHLSSQPPPMHY